MYLCLDTCFLYYKGLLAFTFEHIMAQEILCNNYSENTRTDARYFAAVQPQLGPGVPERWVRRRRWQTDDITPQRTVKLCSVYCKYKQGFIFSF